MKVACGSGLVLLLALATTETTGQSIPSPYRFIETSQSAGPFGGLLEAGGSTVGLQPRAGNVAGLRYAIRLSGPFTVEAEASYFKGDRAVRDTVVVDSARQIVGEAEVNLALVNAALRFNLTGPRTWHSLQPFIAFGAGVAIDLTGQKPVDELVPPDARYDFGTSFAGQLGGGIEWFATDRLSLRVDARSVLWKVKTPAPFLRGEFGQRTPADEWVNNGLFSLGLAIHF